MQRIGSRAQVMHGNAKMTGGGLKKKDLKYNKQGKIVSKKMSAMAKKEKRLQKAGYTTKKGQFGAVKIMKGGDDYKNSVGRLWSDIYDVISKLIDMNESELQNTEIIKTSYNDNSTSGTYSYFPDDSSNIKWKQGTNEISLDKNKRTFYFKKVSENSTTEIPSDVYTYIINVSTKDGMPIVGNQPILLVTNTFGAMNVHNINGTQPYTPPLYLYENGKKKIFNYQTNTTTYQFYTWINNETNLYIHQAVYYPMKIFTMELNTTNNHKEKVSYVVTKKNQEEFNEFITGRSKNFTDHIIYRCTDGSCYDKYKIQLPNVSITFALNL
jgi:hypothetical protein